MNIANTTTPALPQASQPVAATRTQAAATAAGSPTPTAGIGAGQPASDAKPSQQVDYMKLIVAQMRNLNPMDPSSGSDSMPMMMQAEELNQLTALNKAITQLQTMSETSYGAGLVGRTVTGISSANAIVTGAVKALHSDPGGPLLELTNGTTIRLLDVTQVSAA